MKIINDHIPLSNVPGDIWQGYMPSPFDTDEFLIKLDHQPTAAHRLSGSYFLTTGENIVRAGDRQPALGEPAFSWTQHNLNVSDTWVLSDTKINQAWFSFNRNFGGRLKIRRRRSPTSGLVHRPGPAVAACRSPSAATSR